MCRLRAVSFWHRCHAVREAAAAGILRVGKEDTATNIADLFTKMLHRERRNELLSQFTYSSAFGSSGPPSVDSRVLGNPANL